MEFVSPSVLFALFAVSIPVIIHLFNFRKYKKVYFTNVRFIKEIKQETKKRSQLKHLIVLLLRILAIIALVFAFARPFIPLSNSIVKQDKANAVSIYIDNSFSMEARSGEGYLIDDAKNKASVIANTYRSSDVFQLLTNDLEAKHQRFVNRDEFLGLLKEVDLSPSVKDISSIIKFQNDLLSENKSGNKISYIISDLQKSTSNFNQIVEDTNIVNYIIPVLSNNQGNVFIDSCWFNSPIIQLNQTSELMVRIKNVSNVDYEKIPLKLNINDNQKALASIDILANSESNISLPFTNYEAGIKNAVLEITDYPVIYDDKFYFSFDVMVFVPVLCINSNKENIYLNSLFKNDSAFVFENVGVKNLNYSLLRNYKLIILNELDEISSGLSRELKQFISKGGSILIIPSFEPDFISYKNFLTSIRSNYFIEKEISNIKVDMLNTDHEIFNNVFEEIPENIDLPVLQQQFKISKLSKTISESVMSTQNGNTFFEAGRFEKGKIYLLSVPLNPAFSNFQKHALFVPVLYKIALLSKSENKLYFTIGDAENIFLKKAKLSGENVYRIKKTDSDFEIIPGQRNVNSNVILDLSWLINEAGNYIVVNNGNKISGVSFNYDRRESILENFLPAKVKKLLKTNGLNSFILIELGDKNLEQVLNEIERGVQLWKYFIILALILLAGEVIILRFWK